MGKQEQIPWEKLAQYFAGELTGEEHQIMKNWIKGNPVREDKVEQLYTVWKRTGTLPYALNTDQAWSRLTFKMDEREKENLRRKHERSTEQVLLRLYSSKQMRKAGKVIRRVFMVAAAVLIVATVGFLALQYSPVEPSITEERNRVIITRDGERASYILSDGTRVVMHAGSRIEIPENYNEENRELYLEGEAFFETVHNSEKPFIVHSGNSYTRVVGTQFLVQAWPDDTDKKIEVLVSEGMVLFVDRRTSRDEAGPKEVLLTENQRGILTSSQGLSVDITEDMDWYLGWTEGRFVFKNRELKEVLPRLERWYDISIEVADESIVTEKITAEIDYSLPMSDVLRGIAMTLELNVVSTGNRSYGFSR